VQLTKWRLGFPERMKERVDFTLSQNTLAMKDSEAQDHHSTI